MGLGICYVSYAFYERLKISLAFYLLYASIRISLTFWFNWYNPMRWVNLTRWLSSTQGFSPVYQNSFTCGFRPLCKDSSALLHSPMRHVSLACRFNLMWWGLYFNLRIILKFWFPFSKHTGLPCSLVFWFISTLNASFEHLSSYSKFLIPNLHSSLAENLLSFSRQSSYRSNDGERCSLFWSFISKKSKGFLLNGNHWINNLGIYTVITSRLDRAYHFWG